MRRATRLFLWVAGVFLVLGIGAAVLLPSWIDPNQYRGLIESRFEEFLGREVRLGEIGLSVFPTISISVKDLSIQGADAGSEPFVEAGEIRGSIKILPLLRRKLEIRKFTLRDPRIRLRREPDGSWNFDEIIARVTAEKPAAAGGPGQGFSSPQVSRLDIRNGTIILIDNRIDAGRTTQVDLREFDLAIRGFSPDQGFAFDIDVSLPPHSGKRTRLRGRIDLPGTESGIPFRVDLDAPGLDPGAMGPYLDHFLGLEIGEGTVGLAAEAQGSTAGAVDLTGRIDLAGFRPRGADVPPVDLRADFAFSVNAAGDRFSFQSLKVQTDQSELRLQGSVELDAGRYRVDAEVLPSRLRLADLKNILASAGTELPVDISSADPLKISCKIRGFTDDPGGMDLEGSLEVSRLTFRHPSLSSPLENVRGRIVLGDNRFAIREFSATLANSDLNGEMEIEDFAAPAVRFQLHSREARLGEILSFVGSTTEAGAAPADSAAPEADRQEYLGKVTASGTLRIDKGNIDTLAFSGFEGTMDLQGDIVRFDPLRMDLYGGTFTGSASADLGSEPTTFRLASHLENIDVLPLLADNTGMKDFEGRASGEIRAAGPLSDYDGALRSLQGKGRLEIVDGRIGALNVLEILSSASEVFGEQSLKELSGRIAQEGSEFTRLSGKFTVTDGNLRSDDLELLSPDLDVAGKGIFSLLTGGLDGRFEVNLSETVSRSMREEGSKAASLFWNDRTNRVSIPLGLGGTLEAPVPSVDWKLATQGLLERKTREKLGEALRKYTGGQPAGETPQEATDPQPPPGTDVPPAPQPAPGGMSITMEERRFSGNFFLPDLKLSGRFRGVDLSHAGLRVVDAGGNEFFGDQRAFPDLASAENAVRTGDILEVPFFMKIPGKRLIGIQGGLQVTITLFDRQGQSLTERFEVSKSDR